MAQWVRDLIRNLTDIQADAFSNMLVSLCYRWFLSLLPFRVISWLSDNACSMVGGSIYQKWAIPFISHMFMNSYFHVLYYISRATQLSVTQRLPFDTINEWILYCPLICFQRSLANIRSQNWYNRIVKLREILQILGHLLKGTHYLNT